MGALQHLQDLVLDFKAHNVFGAVACRHARHFHHHVKWRGAIVGIRHLVDVCHATRMQASANAKTVELGASF
jgi:hypothetical protein